MLNAWMVRAYYRNADLHIPQDWNLSRKHIRIETLNHKFVKLNRFENRIKQIVEFPDDLNDSQELRKMFEKQRKKAGKKVE